MRFSKKVLAVAMSVLSVFALSFSQEVDSSAVQGASLGGYVCTVWTASDGLPGNTVTDLIQSRNGYIYIGTYEGLVRFDGIEFNLISHMMDDKYVFRSARSIYEDSRGNIWVGANDEGVLCIYQNGEVASYSVADGLPNNSVRSITEDRDGNIWVGTANGIAYITTYGTVERPSGLESYGASDLTVVQLYCDTVGRIWATTAEPDGIYFYGNGRFERYTGIEKIKNPTVYCVTQDSSGGFWFGVGPHYAIYKKGTEEILYDIGFGSQLGTVVSDIVTDSKGGVWFARDTGVTVFRDGVMKSYEQLGESTSNNVNAILEDAEGNMWFGTDRGGLKKLSPGKFNTVQMDTAVNAICEDVGKKVVWLGADNGLYCYDPSTGTFVDNDFTEFCANIRIRHVALANDGSLLVNAYEKYGQILMGKGGIRFWNEESGLSGERTRVSIMSRDKKIYSGTTNGLNIIDPADNSIEIINRQSGIPNDYIMCIYQDQDGTIWCGTDGGGVFSLVNGKIDKIYTKSDGLAGDVVFKIMQLDRTDELWIMTGTGVSRLRDGKFMSIGMENGLETDGIFQMVYDNTGTVWLTSNIGVSSVRRTELDKLMDGGTTYINSKSYGKSDGLISNGVTSTSLSMSDSSGRTWFTLTDGFAIYDPFRMTNKTVPPVQFDRYSLDSEAFEYYGQKVEVAPRVKRLSIKFTGLSFVSPDQLRFRYRLEGFEDEFSPWSMLREVSYTNLKPGTYYFTVQVLNSDEMVGEIAEPMVIVKKPFIWQLWWFWALIVLTVIMVVFLIILSRYRQMRVYQKKLEDEVEAQTKELHQQTIELQTQAEKLEIANHDLERANEQAERLLLNILPKHIARELTERPGEIIANKYSNVSVLFADIVGFTKLSDGLSAEEIVIILNTLFTRFDMQVGASGIEKIKTIGDSYMAASGVTGDSEEENSRKMVDLALKFFGELEDFNSSSPIKLKMRIGINTGNLVAGVIGKTKFIYDIWGDTVNVASRMESTGVPGKIHVTESVYNETRDLFKYGEPVEQEVKGKGIMQTYFIDVMPEN